MFWIKNIILLLSLIFNVTLRNILQYKYKYKYKYKHKYKYNYKYKYKYKYMNIK